MPKKKSPDKRLPVARGYTRDTGYVKVWRELYTCYGRRLGLNGIALWAFLRDHVNRANGLAWPGYRLMQKTFGIGWRKTLTDLITLLEAAGLIEALPAIQALPDARDRRELGVNDRAVVYLVHDPPSAAEFALLIQGRECVHCPFLQRCKSGQACFEKGGVKIPPPPDQGGASLEGGEKTSPPVVGKSHHNKNNTVVVPDALLEPEQQDLAQRMTALKVAKKKQMRLLKQHSRDYLLQKLSMVEHKLAAGSLTNPAGFFIRACEEDWLPPPETSTPQRKRKNNPADIKPPKSTKHYF